MNIAVVDEGNNLTAFARMDGAWLRSIDIAQNKAYTARAFDMDTRTLGSVAQPNQPLFGIHASNDGKLIIFAGGIPLNRTRKWPRRVPRRSLLVDALRLTNYRETTVGHHPGKVSDPLASLLHPFAAREVVRYVKVPVL